MRVTICGPNLRDQSKGGFHIHAAGCGDLKRGAKREPEYENGWTIEAETRQEIVEAIYEDMIEEGDDWRAFDDTYIFDCCKQLDRDDGQEG